MEHVNLMIPDQAPAILFYVTGLGFTRDPFLMTVLTICGSILAEAKSICHAIRPLKFYEYASELCHRT